ncbi:MAG: 4-hydroxy-tetrahydrodipicolinate reductase [Sedimentisphaerales bacterium]|nr:4-hydroxy-tetrahydrodipicolinate reductase [Sedimentisphaerales bacterium]
MKPKLAVIGAAGRMGRRIIACAIDADYFEIIAAVECKNHPDFGKDAGQLAGGKVINVPVTTNYPEKADVVIEFALPESSTRTSEFCVETGAALVIGTTGLDNKQKAKIEAAAKKIPIIYGTNMSVGMNVLFALAGKAAAMLGNDYDIEIVEQHHKFKKDAPSGSALILAEKICEATGRDMKNSLVFGREGKDTLRQQGEIGIHAVRAGGIAGRHEVIYSNAGETVTLGHIAHGREGFSQGALRAAQWLIGKKPKLYTMADVLGLS